MTRERSKRIGNSCALAAALALVSAAPLAWGQVEKGQAPQAAREERQADAAGAGGGSSKEQAERADGADERRGGRRGFRGERQNRENFTEEEWQAAAASMRELAPNTWARFEETVHEDEGFRGTFQRLIIDRYQELQRLKERDEKQYEGEVAQLKIEDDIFGIAAKLRGAEGEAAESLKTELRARVGQLIEQRIQNRQRRIDRLAAQLERERRKLESDSANKEAAIQRKYDFILTRTGDNGGLFANPGGRRGPRQGPGRRGPPQQPQSEQQPPADPAPK